MTDKQIKIDVTQCPYYREGKFCIYLSYKTKCEGDCNWTSYKEMEEQLKRKEKECEELKDKLNCCFCTPYVELNDTEKQRKCVEVTECFRRQLDLLKAENDVLFKAIEEVNKINKRLESENKELKKCYKNNSALLDKEEMNTTKLVNKVMKLEQTLTEIKIFVMQAKHDYNLPKYLFDTILQKISEVENEKI